MILTLKTRHPGALGAGESSWGVGNSLVPLWGRPPPQPPAPAAGCGVPSGTAGGAVTPPLPLPQPSSVHRPVDKGLTFQLRGDNTQL